VAAVLQQREDMVGTQYQNGPGEHRGENRRSGLVDLQGMLEGYA